MNKLVIVKKKNLFQLFVFVTYDNELYNLFFSLNNL